MPAGRRPVRCYNALMTTAPPNIDEVCAVLAAEILRRHDSGASATDIRSAVRDFIIGTGLAERAAVNQEEAPAASSARAVDLVVGDTFIEFKRNLYGGAGIDPQHIAQLDGYLAEALATGRGIRNGVLTDGRRWLLRHVGEGAAPGGSPVPVWVLESAAAGLRLYEWLRDRVFAAPASPIALSRENLLRHFGDAQGETGPDLLTLHVLYQREKERATIRVKRRLWEDLLRAALGEIAGAPADLDDLFIRHTYLSAVIGMAVQASFGIDIYDLAAQEPEDLLQGRRLQSATGLRGIVESDFFAWPAEAAGGADFIRRLARRLARFDWRRAPADIAAALYETVIPPEERRQLGEYYTPQWLADAMAAELVADPLRQQVLDPACGSGAFIVAAVGRFLAAARAAGWQPQATLDGLRTAVMGIDVHPAAVHLARAAWAFAAREAIAAAADYNTEIAAPIYLGDALQLRYRTGDLLAEPSVAVETREADNPTLTFPMSLVERADTFDALLGDIARAIENDADPLLALDDHGISNPAERPMLERAVATLQALHNAGRDHIWAYYTRNVVRPVALSRGKVDVIIGNPPWLNYNRTVALLRTELERQSKDLYGIWVGGRYASNQDVAGLFYARCVDLYLKDGGVIGMVLPHSALQSGQYTKWRRGQWQARPAGRGRNRIPGRTLAVNFGYRPAWDLEPLEPNTFFPIASCVVFAEHIGENAAGAPLAGAVQRWQGPAGTDAVRRIPAVITDTSAAGASPYADYARQGASIRPRRLFLVQETPNPALIPAGRTVTVNPRQGAQDKAPWRRLNLAAITGQTVESSHLYEVYLGESIAPYVALEPLQALLPVRRGEYQIPAAAAGTGGIRLGGLEPRMRARWQTISQLWDDHKARANDLNLLARLDYYGKLSTQLAWQQNPDQDGRPIRLVYTAGGAPTAALLNDAAALVDERLYWVACRNLSEAHYLLAIINSPTLYDAVQPLMSKGQFGARDLHKQLWKLPIPEFDEGAPLHRELAWLGETATAQAAQQLADLRAQPGHRLTVAIARRELRRWLRGSEVGAAAAGAVARLLGND